MPGPRWPQYPSHRNPAATALPCLATRTTQALQHQASQASHGIPASYTRRAYLCAMSCSGAYPVRRDPTRRGQNGYPYPRNLGRRLDKHLLVPAVGDGVVRSSVGKYAWPRGRGWLAEDQMVERSSQHFTLSPCMRAPHKYILFFLICTTAASSYIRFASHTHALANAGPHPFRPQTSLQE
jgi:hypothetical protein